MRKAVTFAVGLTVVSLGLACAYRPSGAGSQLAAQPSAGSQAPDMPAPEPVSTEQPPKVEYLGPDQCEHWSVVFQSKEQMDYYHAHQRELRDLLGIEKDGPLYLAGEASTLSVEYIHMSSSAIVCIPD